MPIDTIGWDIGGAHIKAVALGPRDRAAVRQRPTPIWQGLDHLHRAIDAIAATLPGLDRCRHAITMTGELADLFADRNQGVLELIDAFNQHFPQETILVFAGNRGFLRPAAIEVEDIIHIASANWLATGTLVASRIARGLLIDIGSTTSDLMILRGGVPIVRGTTDIDRLRLQEIVYTGVVRTSLMAVATQVPWQGEWIPLMAEHFATTADVYRLSGELPEHADQMPTADGREKTPEASARRLARLLGTDFEAAPLTQWRTLAHYFRQRQLALLETACERQLSLGALEGHSGLIGAGVGRFLVQELARRLNFPYRDFVDLFPMQHDSEAFTLADCAPAAAVAYLLRQAS